MPAAAPTSQWQHPPAASSCPLKAPPGAAAPHGCPLAPDRPRHGQKRALPPRLHSAAQAGPAGWHGGRCSGRQQLPPGGSRPPQRLSRCLWPATPIVCAPCAPCPSQPHTCGLDLRQAGMIRASIKRPLGAPPGVRQLWVRHLVQLPSASRAGQASTVVCRTTVCSSGPQSIKCPMQAQPCVMGMQRGSAGPWAHVPPRAAVVLAGKLQHSQQRT